MMPIYKFPVIPSTNQKAWHLLDEGYTPPFVVVAAEQTAGRGQWGRQWQSLPGGLYLSLVLSCEVLLVDSFHLTLFTAWGIVGQLRNYQIPVRLKWPNDLLLQGKKLGGIKSEVRSQGNIIRHAVIGVGINWRNPVPEVGINLEDFRAIANLQELAIIVANGIISGYQHYCQDKLGKILDDYQNLLVNLGQKITVQNQEGIIIGVTSQGDLRVRLSSLGARTELTLPLGSLSLGYEISS